MNEEAVEYARSRSLAKVELADRLRRWRDLLVRKWWIPALGAIVGLGIGVAIWLLEPPAFVSVGRMIVSIKLAIPEGSVYNEELNNFLGTQTALMQSSVVVSRAQARVAVQNPDLVPEHVSLKVAVSPKTSIFVLEAIGKDPKYVRTFLQRCMEEYIIFKKEMRAQTSDTTVAGLTEQVLRLEKELRAGENELVEFQKSNSVVLLQDQGNSAGIYLTALNQRLASLKSEFELLGALTLDQNLERRQELSMNVATTNDAARAAAANTYVSVNERGDSDYLKAKQLILLLKADQQDLAQFLRPRHPKMIAMTEEIARRERLLEIFRQQSAEQLANRKASLGLQIANLERDVQQWDARTLDISRKSAEHQRLKANAQRVQALYDRLLATMQTLDVNKEISPESVTIMEPASPALADKPKHTKRLVIIGLLTIALSVGLLLLLDQLDDRVNSYAELQELFDEDVLVQIPRERPQRGERELKLLEPDDERHPFLEAYRNLRSSLLYKAENGQRPKTLLLTSSIPDEGKSLTAANLAITLGNAGSSVLLVDADLRKGVLQNLLGVEAEKGLTEVLSQERDWQTLLRPTRFANVSFLPRGGFTRRSSELFISPAMAAFLGQAASQFDFVLLDTAPVMAADDVTSLAPRVNAVLFVLRAEHTSARIARAALDVLYQRQAQIAGLVFNAVRHSSADYYYYYKYKDYSTREPNAARPGRDPSVKRVK
jgi:capsular exopolysaccharide synthesis family protein